MKDTCKYFEALSDACIKYGKAQEEGKVKLANKQSDIIYKIKQEIRNFEKEGILVIKPLLSHDNDYVKLIVASALLEKNDIEAVSVLEELSKRKRLLGFEAKMILQEWEKRKNKI